MATERASLWCAQGLNKAETAAQHGEAQVKIWRRSYDIPPPPLSARRSAAPVARRRDTDLKPNGDAAHGIPQGHRRQVSPLLALRHRARHQVGKRVLIAAHGNSLRALVKYLDKMSEQEIVELNIPTGIPLIYELDGELRPEKFYLGDEEAARQKAAAVAIRQKAHS